MIREIGYFIEDHWKKILLVGGGLLAIILVITLFTGNGDDEAPDLVMEGDDLGGGEQEQETPVSDDISGDNTDSNTGDEPVEDSDEINEDNEGNGEDGSTGDVSESGSEIESGSEDEELRDNPIDEEYIDSLRSEDLEDIDSSQDYSLSGETISVIEKHVTVENNQEIMDYYENINLSIEDINSVSEGFELFREYESETLECGTGMENYSGCINLAVDRVLSGEDMGSAENEVTEGITKISQMMKVLDETKEIAETELSGNETINVNNVIGYKKAEIINNYLKGVAIEDVLYDEMSVEDLGSEVSKRVQDENTLYNSDDTHFVYSVIGDIVD